MDQGIDMPLVRDLTHPLTRELKHSKGGFNWKRPILLGESRPYPEWFQLEQADFTWGKLSLPRVVSIGTGGFYLVKATPRVVSIGTGRF